MLHHDPHCPALEMCSECGKFPVPDDHSCEDPEIRKISILPIVLIILILDGAIGYGIWQTLKYGGYFR